MIAELRDASRHRLGRAPVDPAARPVRVRIESGPRRGETAYLDWEGALDDAGHLRRCIACGGPLFRAKRIPQVTPFLSALLAAAVAVAALGESTSAWLVGGIITLAAIDIAILLLARPRLVCYGCGSAFLNVPIARYVRRWDARIARATRARAGRQPGAANAPGPGQPSA